MNIKKMNIILFLSIVLFLVGTNFVHAENCDALLTQDAAELLRDVFTFIRIMVPILLIVLCAADAVSVVISQDDNAIKKASGRIVKRFIAAALVFFVPLIVEFVLGIDAIKNSLNLVDDPTCGITESETGESETNGG